jgi:hypothetical protein
MARSARELRGNKFVAPRDRMVELDPRPFLLVQNQARERGITLGEMLNAIVLMWGENESGRRVEQRMKAEELEQKLAERERARANAAKRAWAAGRRARLRAQEREARKLNEALKEICPKETLS